MTQQERIPQTILLDGPEGVGKATLARRFAAAMVGRKPDKIEQDDLSLEANAETIAEREKWPSDKRNEDPLLFATHPDFLTFPPDGPLRQITIEQMRLLKERAQFKPLAWSAPRFPDRSHRSRQRAGREFAAEDPGRAARALDPVAGRGESLRFAAYHPLARRIVPSVAVVERGDAGVRRVARAFRCRAAHRAGGRQPRPGGFDGSGSVRRAPRARC